MKTERALPQPVDLISTQFRDEADEVAALLSKAGIQPTISSAKGFGPEPELNDPDLETYRVTVDEQFAEAARRALEAGGAYERRVADYSGESNSSSARTDKLVTRVLMVLTLVAVLALFFRQLFS